MVVVYFMEWQISSCELGGFNPVVDVLLQIFEWTGVHELLRPGWKCNFSSSWTIRKPHRGFVITSVDRVAEALGLTYAGISENVSCKVSVGVASGLCASIRFSGIVKMDNVCGRRMV